MAEASVPAWSMESSVLPDPGSTTYSLDFPEVERKFRAARRFTAIYFLVILGVIGTFWLGTTPFWPSTSMSPTHESLVNLAVLFTGIFLPFDLLFVYIIARESAARPIRLVVSSSGFSIVDRAGRVRVWEFRQQRFKVVFTEFLSGDWGQPIAVILRPRFPSTFLPREALHQISEAALRVGLSVRSDPISNARLRWTLRAPAIPPG